MEDNLYQLTIEQIQQIRDKGYTHVMLDNRVIRITIDDIVVKKEEVDNFLRNHKNDRA